MPLPNDFHLLLSRNCEYHLILQKVCVWGGGGDVFADVIKLSILRWEDIFFSS